MSQILDGTGLVHSYIEYPIGLRNPIQLAKLGCRIRALRIQTLIYMAAPRGRLSAWRDAMFFRSCGIQKLIGLPYKNDLQQVHKSGNGSYEYEGSRLARCLAELGDSRLDDPSAFDLHLSSREIAVADNKLSIFSKDRPFLAASFDVNVWGDSNWSKLLHTLSLKMPEWNMVMLGSTDERDRCNRLLKHWQGRSLNLCGILTIRESAAVLARCQLFLGHDSGPMHLAAAVGTPCIAIFSSRNLPGEWFPYGKSHRVMYQPMPCQGCKLDVCEEYKKACIRSISIEIVEEAVLQIAAILEAENKTTFSK